MENAQADSNPAKPNTSDDIDIELSKEFLRELKNNAYRGMFDEDVVDHIAKVLELLDLIKIPAHDEHDIEEGNELRQMKRKEDNKNDEQPNKRVCKAEKFEAIKYSLGPNETYIAIRRCEYNAWKRNEDGFSIRRIPDLVKEKSMIIDEEFTKSGYLEVLES
ncbi:hypothetical protein Tco_0877342 [Tanacetum coccineum]|uniref:Uncharacterized protein n=1 Tax=Tanacetum coccineum TaxID=301880 RepID=A0ABQ5BUV5_9ASTR